MDMVNRHKELAIIIPVYNEGKALQTNFKEIVRVLEQDRVDCRFMFVDDGSTDNTWQVLESIVKEYPQAEAIRFARNFGKEIALAAGLDSIDAQLYLLMDSDLQHPPDQIRPMLELLIKEDANIVEGIKITRGKESLFYRSVAKLFYWVLNVVTHLDMRNSSDFKLLDKQVVESIRRFDERNLFIRGIVKWVGFKTVQHPFHVEERVNGVSHFSTAKLAMLALNATLSYTSKPLYITMISGLIFLFFAIILGIQTLANYLVGNALDGFSTVILVLLITGSMIMISLGIIGTYISRIYDEIKARPRYIVKDKIQ
ncbi:MULTISPECIES: glycosyltransferase family 2 protein [unclassified Fusibacter]|uniref:glycosyltransferase family 2 protein n=1 Tax=unclassified Fusibacter TaxID=2624464 RepID=UPI001013AE23|nr:MULTISPECIES: glycosyltransferase family 2 protein [unclassified Fusibacter]MCK8061456.1 glycosyltransferase family 2 protein [Fusibacter sp. A2]NPE23643.1 glycosyltransferase family 2 protein [Fusibacter sp. A1]RXV58915.1 glycosyltransferase [Fusibacter sp. A1]